MTATKTTTAVAKIDATKPCSNSQEMHQLLKQAGVQIQAALPAVLRGSAERLARCALTEFQRNPEIARCSGRSILSCVIQAAQLGLEVGGPTGQCYMVPYKNEATFLLGYRGMISLAFRSGQVANIFASLVHEKDEFKVHRGTKPGIDHVPVLRDAGKPIGAYAVIVYKSGQCDFEMMSFDEIEAHRKNYSKQPGGMMWTKAWGEAAKKTVLRKLLKRCPLAVELPGEAGDADEVVTSNGEAIQIEVTPVVEPEPVTAGAMFAEQDEAFGSDISAQAK